MWSSNLKPHSVKPEPCVWGRSPEGEASNPELLNPKHPASSIQHPVGGVL
jgi:hypothetical protein